MNAPAHPFPSPTGATRLLVLEDDQAIREILAGFLADEGYQVQTAASGHQALSMIADEQPDLILLDMWLPIMDGWAFAAELRARGLTIPLMVMTAAHDAQEWAEQIGAAGYASKPISLPLLLRRIEQIAA